MAASTLSKEKRSTIVEASRTVAIKNHSNLKNTLLAVDESILRNKSLVLKRKSPFAEIGPLESYDRQWVENIGKKGH